MATPMHTVSPLTFRVMIKDEAVSPGGKAVLLCDENGNMIGGQIETIVKSSADDIAEITVKFAIDGRTVRFG